MTLRLHPARTWVLALLAGLAPAVHAQPAAQPAAPNGGLQAPADDSLLRELGGQPGIEALVAEFAPRLLADPHLGEFFKNVPQPAFRLHLAQMLCVVAGGGCAYEGRAMQEVHKDMDISRADFNAVVRVLQDAMDARHVPFSTQNRLLARLAPMHREIVTTH